MTSTLTTSAKLALLASALIALPSCGGGKQLKKKRNEPKPEWVGGSTCFENEMCTVAANGPSRVQGDCLDRAANLARASLADSVVRTLEVNIEAYYSETVNASRMDIEQRIRSTSEAVLKNAAYRQGWTDWDNEEGLGSGSCHAMVCVNQRYVDTDRPVDELFCKGRRQSQWRESECRRKLPRTRGLICVGRRGGTVRDPGDCPVSAGRRAGDELVRSLCGKVKVVFNDLVSTNAQWQDKQVTFDPCEGMADAVNANAQIMGVWDSEEEDAYADNECCAHLCIPTAMAREQPVKVISEALKMDRESLQKRIDDSFAELEAMEAAH